MGCLLAGGPPLPRTGAGSILVPAPAGHSQRHAVGLGPANPLCLGQHNSWVSRSLGARENPCFSAQIRPERTIGVWSPLGSSPCGCPCNPWSKAKNSSLPRPAARSDNLSHIGRSGHTAEVCHFGPHIVPHSRNI